MMALTGCSKDEFTCKDGSCVNMERRCTGKADCLDGSDENECKKIITFKGYNKFLVPPPTPGEETLLLNISIIIDDIITIDENNGYFKVKITFIRGWYNPLLQYQNLKRTTVNNAMTKDDVESMWM